jgi:hypothetical protein
MTVAARFWAKVAKTDTCWLWTASQNGRGYGQFGIGSRTDGTKRPVLAHRYAYELAVGPIPAGLQIDHLCRVTLCVNPSHLEPVTARVNNHRSNAAVATRERHQTQTHCLRGHQFDIANTLYSGGQRVCRACLRVRARQRRSRLKENDTP